MRAPTGLACQRTTANELITPVTPEPLRVRTSAMFRPSRSGQSQVAWVSTPSIQAHLEGGEVWRLGLEHHLQLEADFAALNGTSSG